MRRPGGLRSPQGGKRALTWLILLVAILLPAIFFTPLMDGGAGSTGVMVLFYAGLVAAVGGLAAFVLALAKKQGKGAVIGGCCLTVSGALLALIAKTPMYQDYAVWTAPGVNSIAYWTIGCALMSLTILSAVYVCMKRARPSPTTASASSPWQSSRACARRCAP